MARPKPSTVAKTSTASPDDGQAPGESQQTSQEHNGRVELSTASGPTDDDFESRYLQQATKEFANDLEKLRTANDFKGERSVQILVDALKQGAVCFSQEERQRLSQT